MCINNAEGDTFSVEDVKKGFEGNLIKIPENEQINNLKLDLPLDIDKKFFLLEEKQQKI